MAKSVEQYLQEIIGSLVLQLAQSLSNAEKLAEQVVALDRENKELKAKLEDAQALVI